MTTTDITITGIESRTEQQLGNDEASTGAAQPAAHPSDGAAKDARHNEKAFESTPQSRENAFAITSFVLGIVSVVAGWTFIAPIVGLVFGVLALRRKTAERTLALWGVWLNAAMLALSVLTVAAFAFVVLAALMVGGPAVFV